jgi:hypothetical protein
VSGVKVFVTVGAFIDVTVKVSLAVFPIPPFVDITFPLVLLYVPPVPLVTSTTTTHVPLAAIVPPLKLSVVSPPPGANVGVPQFVVVAFGTPATTTSVGRLSVNETPVSATPLFGFVIVNVSVLVSPARIVSGVNALLILGGSSTTRSSLADTVLNPKSVCRSPTEIVFVCIPAVLLVTSTVIVQPPAGIVEPLVYPIVEPPATASTVPVHVPPMFGVAATTTFTGRVSQKADVSVATTAFVFPNVSVTVLTSPAAIVSGENSFVTLGAAAVTVRSSLAVPLSGASVLVTTLVVFVTVPGVELVTSTSTVHVPLAAIVPPLKSRVVSPLPGVNAGVPQFVVLVFGVLATAKPAGKLSVNATPLRPAPLF